MEASTIYWTIDADLCGSASNAIGSSLVASSTSTEGRAQEQGESEERLDDGHVVYWWCVIIKRAVPQVEEGTISACLEL